MIFLSICSINNLFNDRENDVMQVHKYGEHDRKKKYKITKDDTSQTKGCEAFARI